MWHWHCLGTDTKTLVGIGENLVDAEKALPKTSPTHTVFVQSATEGMFLHVHDFSCVSFV